MSVNERPIRFSERDVTAVMEGRVTQARRVMSFQPKPEWTEIAVEERYPGHPMATYRAFPGRGTARWAICDSPYGCGPGDRLRCGDLVMELTDNIRIERQKTGKRLFVWCLSFKVVSQ